MGFRSGDGKDLRLADLLLFNWLQGKDACLDVTGISPFAGMGAKSWAPAVALLNAVEKKKKKYASICEDNGYKFIPFAFSTFGEFDKDALDTLLRIKIADFVPGRAVIDAAQRKRVKYEAECATISNSRTLSLILQTLYFVRLLDMVAHSASYFTCLRTAASITS
ncbi:hypothetical protein Tco_0862019 [Tanacetum coccineum]